jgi:hypothetical protein
MNNRRGKPLRWIASFLVPLLLYPFVLRGLIEAFHPKAGWLVYALDRLDLSQSVSDALVTFIFRAYDLLIGIWASPFILFALWFSAGLLGLATYALVVSRSRTSRLAARLAST